MPVSAPPPQRTSGIRPIVGGLPDVAYPEEQYMPGGLPRTQQRTQEAAARAQRITEENKQYAAEQAEIRRQEVLAQERAYFAGGLATREREAREAYESERATTKQKVTEQVLFSLERRGLLARYGVGAVYGAEMAPSKMYGVQAGKYKGTTLYTVKPSQIASADIPDQLKAYVEPQIEERFKQQDVLFEKNVSAWREESWTSYENYLATAFPPGIFLQAEPQIPIKPAEQPSPAFELPDVTGFLINAFNYMQKIREQRYIAMYGSVGRILAKSDEFAMGGFAIGFAKPEYLAIGVVASGQSFIYSLAGLAGIRGEVPSTWLSAILQGKGDMPASYYAGTFLGDYLIGLGIGSVVGKISEATGIGAKLSGMYRGSWLDKYLFERSPLYQRLTGGMAKQIFAPPRVGFSVPEIGEEFWSYSMQKGTSMVLVNQALSGTEKFVPTYLAWGQVGLVSLVPEFQRGFEHVYKTMPADYLSPQRAGLSFRDFLYGTRAQTTIPELLGAQYQYASILGSRLMQLGAIAVERGEFPYGMAIASGISGFAPHGYTVPTRGAPSITAFAVMGRTAFVPKAPRWSFPSTLIREPIELPSLQRLPYTPEFRKEYERGRKSLLVPTILRPVRQQVIRPQVEPTSALSRSRTRLEAPQRLRRFQEPWSALKPTSRYERRQRTRPIVEPYSALRVGSVQEAPQMLKPVEEARQIQTPRSDFPSPTEVKPSLEVPRLRSLDGGFQRKRKVGKRRLGGYVWGKRAYPVMTGEEFMVSGLIGAKKK